MQLFTYIFVPLLCTIIDLPPLSKYCQGYISLLTLNTFSLKGEIVRAMERIKPIYDISARSSGDVESEWRVFRVNEGSFSPDARIAVSMNGQRQELVSLVRVSAGRKQARPTARKGGGGGGGGPSGCTASTPVIYRGRGGV